MAAALTRSHSGRLPAYLAVAVAGLLVAVAGGRPAAAAIAAPAALAAVIGLVLAERPTLVTRFSVPGPRVLEGEPLLVEVVVASEAPVDLEVLVPLQGVARLGGGVLGARQRTDRLVLDVQVVPERWGLAGVGPLWVRVRGPLGLVRWTGPMEPAASLHVLPPASTLRRLTAPADGRATAGLHLTSRRGEGIELAEVRPYQPGDSLRSVNWTASSRRGSWWVNQRHPERSADILLVLDTFADADGAPSPALDRAVRIAWLLADAHLRANDRVGVLAFGGYPSWLAPGGGDRARYQVAEALLTAAPTWTEAQRELRHLPSRALPPGSTILAVTPLHDLRFVDALIDVRRRGHRVRAVVVDVADTYEAALGSTYGGLASRLWALERERRGRLLATAGVPVTDCAPSDSPLDAVAALARSRG